MGKHCITAQTVTDATESKISTQTNQDTGGKRPSLLKNDLKNSRYLSISKASRLAWLIVL
jgi:hypothetical protein